MTHPSSRKGNPANDRSEGTETASIVPIEHVQSQILLIRGQKVILDTDLAALYGVETRVLVQAVKRHIERFPPDFMFQLGAAGIGWRDWVARYILAVELI